jgi:hypothetical protein
MVACNEIGLGKRAAPDLLGDVVIRPILESEAYQTKLDSKRVTNKQVLSLLKRYSSRKNFGNDGHKRRPSSFSSQTVSAEEYSIEALLAEDSQI